MSELFRKPALKYDVIIQSCLILILIFTPLAFGAKKLWAITPVYLTTLIALAALCLRINSEGAASFRWTVLGAPILLFLAIAIASSLVSACPHGSIMALYRVITYVAIFYLVVNGIDTKERMARLVGVIVGMGALLSFIGIVLYLGHSYYRYWLPGSTLSSTFINRDHFAGYLEMVIPLAAALLFTDMDKEKKVLVGFFLVMMIIAFVLAASRGAWVSLVMSSCVLAPFLFRKKLLKRMLLAVIVCGAVTYFALSHFDLSVASARAKTIIEGAGIDELRIQIWMGSIELIKARPLLGWGIGSFIYVFPQFQPIAISQRYIIDYAHNDYLHMASEIGLVGLLAMLWIMIGALWFGLKEFWRSGGRFKRSILLGASIGVMSMSLHSFVDFNLHIPANAILFVTLIGIIMAMRGRRRYE